MGFDVVIDASNGPLQRRRERCSLKGAHRLLEVEAGPVVGHHVRVYIVGIEAVRMAYVCGTQTVAAWLPANAH